MPAISALPNHTVPGAPGPWERWSSLLCFNLGEQSWSTLGLLLIVLFLFIIAVASRRRHRSWHLPTPTSPPSMTETSSDLHYRRQPSPGHSSSATPSKPSPPVPTIRRCSYPLSGGERLVYNPKPRWKERTWTEYDLGVEITRRDTIEKLYGCRRHTMVVGGLEGHQRCPAL